MTYVAVATAESGTCQGQDHVVLKSPSGYLANIVTEETRCGGDSAPWRIDAQPGQRINLTLYDFSHHEAARHSSSCLIYAFVKEVGSSEKISICGGGQRTKNVYISVLHSLLVFVIRSYNAETERHFLLKYDGEHTNLTLSRLNIFSHHIICQCPRGCFTLCVTNRNAQITDIPSFIVAYISAAIKRQSSVNVCKIYLKHTHKNNLAATRYKIYKAVRFIIYIIQSSCRFSMRLNS